MEFSIISISHPFNNAIRSKNINNLYTSLRGPKMMACPYLIKDSPCSKLGFFLKARKTRKFHPYWNSVNALAAVKWRAKKLQKKLESRTSILNEEKFLE